MKKILAILSALTISVSAAASIVACGYKLIGKNDQKDDITQQDISTLKLRIDIDSLEATYENIATEVKKQIATISKFAELDVDYTIDQTAFNEESQLTKPQLVNVSAMEDSKFLHGKFNVVIFKNFAEILKDWDTQGDYDQSIDQLAILKEKIKEVAPIAQENIDYKISLQENGSWTVKTVGYESLIEIDFSFSTTKFNIGTIDVNNVVINDDMDDIISEITDKIAQFAPKALEGIDFDITGDTLKVGNIIKIGTLPNSKYLVGSKDITVEKFDISPLAITDLDALSNDSEIANKLISKLFEDKNLKVEMNIDFEIKWFNQREGRIVASENSEIIKGTIDFKLEKINISVLKDTKFTNLKITSEIDDVIAEVNKVISNLLIRENETTPRKVIGNDDFRVSKGSIAGRWEVEAVEAETKILTGSFSINLEKIDISTGINVLPTFVGDNYNNLITDVLEQIEQKLSAAKVIEDVDYKIIDNTKKLKESGTIILEAIETSNIITGKVTINVNPKSISDIVLYDKLINLADVGNLNDSIIEKINSLFTTDSGIKISQADYKIYDASEKAINWMEKPSKGTFKVKANDDSKIISGSFNFNIEAINLSELEVEPVELGDDYSNLINSLLESITSLVKNLEIVEGIDYKITDSTDGLTKSGTVILEALSTSTSLIESKTIEVSPKSINELSLGKIGLKPVDKFNDLIIAKIQTLFDIEKIKVERSDFVIYNIDFEYYTDEITVDSKYRIEASDTSRIISGDFIIEVFQNDISALSVNFIDGYDVSTDEEIILRDINNAIDDFARSNLGDYVHLTEGNDYEILDENGQLKNLNEAGEVIVKAKNNKDHIIFGEFSFEIRKYDLANFKVKSPEAINITEEDPNRFIGLIEYTFEQTLLFKKVVRGIDYEISPFENWVTDGEIYVEALEGSKLLKGISVIKINQFDISNIKVEESFNIGDKVAGVKTLVKDKIENYFYNNDSWVSNPELGIDYEILGISNGDYLTTTGSQAIKVRGIYNSKKLTGEFTIAVNEIDLGLDLKVYDISGSNYLLTSRVSTWGPDALEWDNIARQSWKWILDGTGTRENPSLNPIKQNEILQANNYFLASTRGIYIASHFIEGTQNLTWTADDIISMDDNIIITTQGTWYVSEHNITDWHDYEFIKPVRITELDNLKPSEFIAKSNNMIVTTRGVWTETILNNKATYSKVTTIKVLDELTKDDLLVVNDKFLITKKGIWWKKYVNNGSLHSIKEGSVVASDILEFNDNYIIIKGYGAFVNGSLIDIAEGHEKILAKNNNYLVTSEFIYWRGVEMGEFSKTSQILAISESFLVTTQGAYYNGIKLTRAGFNTFRANEILGVNRNFLITTKGVQFRNKIGIDGSVDNYFNAIKKSELLGYTDNVIIVAGKRSMYVNDNGQRFLLGTLNATNFITLNDHYVISKGVGIWYINSPNETTAPPLIPLYLYVNDVNQIIALKGKMLVTTKGMWKAGKRYELSDGFKHEEIIAVNEDRVVTTRGIFYGIGGKLNRYK